MGDVLVMHVAESIEKLGKVEPCDILGESTGLSDEIKEFTAINVLEDDVVNLLGAVGVLQDARRLLDQIDDVGVI